MPSALLVLGGGSFVSRQVCGPPSGGDLCTQRAGALSEGGLLPPPRWLLPSETKNLLNHIFSHFYFLQKMWLYYNLMGPPS